LDPDNDIRALDRTFKLIKGKLLKRKNVTNPNVLAALSNEQLDEEDEIDENI
jgi:hypothetical protein